VIPDLARNVLSLDRNWLYGGQAVTGCNDPAFDDSGFERVTLPHANRTFSWHGFDDEEYQLVSVYRRHFTLPEEPKKRRVFVDFEGVMTAATVTLNGEMLGEHRGGYTPFSFEISECVSSDGDNVLAGKWFSTELPGIPPFGGKLDYLTFG